MDVAPEMSGTTIEELQMLFLLFGPDENGTIEIEHLKPLIRACGQNPTHYEFEAMTFQVDPTNSGRLTFSSLIELLQSDWMKDSDSEEASLRAAFAFFDKDGEGYVEANELRDILMNLGEPLTSEEIDEMYGLAGVDSTGRINYEIFVQIFSPSGTLA